MPNFRTKVRKSLLALMVSYLNDGTINTSKFTFVNGAPGAYPQIDGIFTFPIGADVYQIALYEAFRFTLPLGVTINFSDDAPSLSRAMPQQYSVKVEIAIRLPINPVGESFAQELALQIDQALFRCSGKCPIMDYDVYPAVDAGASLEWQTVKRGQWERVQEQMVKRGLVGFETPNVSSVEVLNFEAEMVYFMPQTEW